MFKGPTQTSMLLNLSILSSLEGFVPLIESLPDGSNECDVILDEVEQMEGVSFSLVSVHQLHLLLNPG